MKEQKIVGPHDLIQMSGPFQFLMANLVAPIKRNQVVLMEPRHDGIVLRYFEGTPEEMLPIEGKFLSGNMRFIAAQKQRTYSRDQAEDLSLPIVEITVYGEGEKEVINLCRYQVLRLDEESRFSIKALPGTCILTWGSGLEQATLENTHVGNTETIEYIEGKLTDAQRAEIDAHLAICQRCRAFIEFSSDALSELDADNEASGSQNAQKGIGARLRDLFRKSPRT